MDQHRDLTRCLAIVDKTLTGNRQAFAQRLADAKAQDDRDMKKLRKMADAMSQCVSTASIEDREKQVGGSVSLSVNL